MIKELVHVSILPSEDKRSFVYEVTNQGDRKVQLSIPHPLTDVMLWQSGSGIDRAFFPLQWDQLPEVELQPGATVRYRIGLAPYWLEVTGEVHVECNILIDRNEVRVSEKLLLDIPTRKQIKEESNSRLERGETGISTQHRLVSTT